MRKQLQVNTGQGWNNLTSEFYANGDNKAEAVALRKIEQQKQGWPSYRDFRNAEFRIIDTL